MSLVSTHAIVLRTYRYSETSKIVRLATRDLGVQSAIAKGVLRPRSPFGAALEATEAIWARFRARSTRATVHLLLPDAPGLSMSNSARGTLPHLEGGSFFVLPPHSSLGRLEVLRSVFARLVP